MSGSAIILLFSIHCAGACTATAGELERVETEVGRLLAEHAFVVKPAPRDSARPTGRRASAEVIDEAESRGVDRILVLDLEPKERVLWLTHYVRGFAGPWSVGQVACARTSGRLECPELERVLAGGLRPRRAEDVDVVSALRVQAPKVAACVKKEDQTPIDQRIFGRVEMDLEALASGHVRVRAIAPALVAKAPLGRCLRDAMESMSVGAFEGDALRFRIPVDLD